MVGVRGKSGISRVRWDHFPSEMVASVLAVAGGDEVVAFGARASLHSRATRLRKMQAAIVRQLDAPELVRDACAKVAWEMEPSDVGSWRLRGYVKQQKEPVAAIDQRWLRVVEELANATEPSPDLGKDAR